MHPMLDFDINDFNSEIYNSEIDSYGFCLICKYLKRERYTMNPKKIGLKYNLCTLQNKRCDSIEYCEIGERYNLNKKLKKVKNVK
jgi:hypothetical protein